VKSGRTAEGAAAAASHTGALAGSDLAVDALLEQCGILRANSVEDLFDMAMAFNASPLPMGPRVAVLTDAGGPAIMATDRLGAEGLTLATLSDETKAALAKDLSPDASVANPVDMLGSGDHADYERSMRILLADDDVDAVVVLYVPPVHHDPLAVARSIVEATKGQEKPVLCVFMAREDVLQEVQLLTASVLPIYRFPESAVRALGALARYRRMRDRPAPSLPDLDVDRNAAGEILRAAADEGRADLTLDESRRVMEAYGIRFAASTLVSRREDLESAAAALGFPLVMKISSPDVSHKTEVGGVLTDLRTPEEIVEAWDTVHARAAALSPPAVLEGALLQEMRSGAQEMILGVATDPMFGPLIMAGMGGVLVEVANDVTFRVHPIGEEDAGDMIDELRASRLLEPFRGRPALCREAYRMAILRLDRMIADWEGILEVDVNPFMVGATEKECVAVDGRIRIDPAAIAAAPA